MPDWKIFVRNRLPHLGLFGPREEEIIEELAQQLESRYDAALSHGASESAAAAQAAA